MLNKICAVCKKPFEKKLVGRIKISVKKEKGESVAWICPQDAPKIKVG